MMALLQNFAAHRQQREVQAQLASNAQSQAFCLNQIRAYQDELAKLQGEAEVLRKRAL